jgi:PST family polysaccharide transporter
MAFSFFIAWFYGDDVYISLGFLLSISIFFSALNMVPNGILNRDKKFKSIAVRTIVVYTFSAIIAIIMAYLGFKYYALVVQSVLSALLTFLWNYVTTNPGFNLVFRFDSIRKVLNYSGYQFAFNMVNYFSRNLDNLLTGKFMGSVQLGYYNKAYTLMLYPVDNLTGVISPVLHPILSDYQNDKRIIYSKYLQIFKLLFCVASFVVAVCFLAGEELIDLIYGPQWKETVLCFQLLTIGILPQMLNSSAGSIFQALGNTKLLFQNSCINTVLTVAAIIIGVFWGKNIYNLALCVGIAYVFHFFTAYFMLIKWGFHYKIREFLKDISKNIIVLMGMLLAVCLFPSISFPLFISLIIKGFYLLVVFLVLLVATKEIRLFIELFR